MRAMKRSGFIWIGDIPEAWGLARIGSVFRERKQQVSSEIHAPLSVTKQGVIPQLESAAKSDAVEKRKLIKRGDFVINSRSDRKGSSGISLEDGSCSSIYIVLEPRGIEGDFTHYLLKSEAFQEEFYRWGSGIVDDLWSTRFAAMKMISIPLPSLQEQKLISSYLDQETSQIDALISKKEQLIEKLLERRQALITQVVTKGLDPHVPMKDSGVEWLGEVPSTWPLGKLSYYAAIKLGKMLDKSESEGSELLPYLSAISIQNETLQIKTDKQMWASIGDQKSLNLVKDDLLVVEGGMAGMTAHLQANLPGVIFQNSINRVRIQKNNFQARYVFYWLNCLRNLGVVESVCNQATIMHLTKEKLAALTILRPPKSIQDQIVTYLDKETTQIDTLVEKTRKAIELLKERRQALITQVVTGKIDVRGFASGNS